MHWLRRVELPPICTYRYEKKIMVINMAMSVLQKRTLKSKLFVKLEENGFKVSATDTPDIIFFTDKRINSKSKRYSTQKNLEHPYMTSFGEVGAKKLLGSLSK